MCNDDAQVATSWVLENDWRELEYTGETTRHTGWGYLLVFTSVIVYRARIV